MIAMLKKRQYGKMFMLAVKFLIKKLIFSNITSEVDKPVSSFCIRINCAGANITVHTPSKVITDKTINFIFSFNIFLIFFKQSIFESKVNKVTPNVIIPLCSIEAADRKPMIIVGM